MPLGENVNKEWSERKKWNPFNSYKLLSQVYRWQLIKKGSRIPQPGLVTVDPTNNCNLNCRWCNSEFIIKNSESSLSEGKLIEIAEFLPEWKGSDDWKQGVEAVCIAGGGEPLLNEHTGSFIEKCSELGIETGIVTNGTMIDRFIEPLSKCTWVGVSIDAGTSPTMQKLKGNDLFDKTIENIRKLVEYSKQNDTKLAKDLQGYGVSYKYLLHPSNVHEISKAASIAKEIGCKNLHIRPAGVAWDKIGSKEISFDSGLREEFSRQIGEARKLEDESFGVFGITHKFNERFESHNKFDNCHAIFMTAVFMPPTDNNPEHFNLGLCCDRRGDKGLLLGENIDDVKKVGELWGSEKHWQIFEKINVEKCPRCTYQPHNQIFKHVISKDNMTYKFI